MYKRIEQPWECTGLYPHFLQKVYFSSQATRGLVFHIWAPQYVIFIFGNSSINKSVL